MINDFSNYAYSITYDKPFEIDIKKDSNIIKDTELFMQYSFDKYMDIK